MLWFIISFVTPPHFTRGKQVQCDTATFLLGCHYLLLNMSILNTEKKCSLMVRDTDSGRQNNVSSNGVVNTVPPPPPPQQKVDSGTTAANTTRPKVHPPDGK